MPLSRRNFLTHTGLAALASAPLLSFSPARKSGAIKQPFVHQVYVWLKNPQSEEDKNKVIEGMRKLSAVKTIRQFHIGVPVPSQRDVVDSSYTLSWLVLFDSKQDEEAYQVDPIHLEFVKTCSPYWNKVVVHDSVRV